MKKVYYIMAKFQNEPLYIALISEKICSTYEKHLKKTSCYLSPAPTHEFYEECGLTKHTIDTKADF